MKSYLLLRNNVETGPYTREEIIAQHLVSTDLVWVEGESATWKYPSETDELQPHQTESGIRAERPSDAGQTEFVTANGIFVALPAQYDETSHELVQGKEEASEEVVLETRFSQPLETIKANHAAASASPDFQFRRTFSKPHSAVWLMCVLTGVFFFAFVIKRIVDAGSENLPTKLSASLPAIDRDASKRANETYYQNALATELVPIDTVTLKPVKKAPKKINLRKLVQLEANDYQVGLLGGIKNLRLLVTNHSGFVLDRVKIRLQYLKPNGDVLKTENLSIKKVDPKSSKSLAVSPQKRGVRIKYLITDIQSKQNTALMLRL
jgi:hypothetical protein